MAQYAVPFDPKYLAGLETNSGAFRRPDQGLDFQLAPGAPLYALASGTVFSGSDPKPGGFGPDVPVLKLDTPINGQSYIYYGHSDVISSLVGKHVDAGALIGHTSVTGHSAPPGWLEIGWGANNNALPSAPGSAAGGGWTTFSQSMKDLLLSVAKTGKVPKNTGGGASTDGSPSTPAGVTPNAPDSNIDNNETPPPLARGEGDPNNDMRLATRGWAKAAAFSTFIALPDALNTQESMLLQGAKSMMNDKPLMPFIEQLCQSCLRNFQSLPNGNFFAFFPDYFGGFGQRTPYWQIEDIEIIDGRIDLSDDALATHVFVVGDIVNFDGVNLFDMLQSGGVVNIENAFSTGFLNGPGTDPFGNDEQTPTDGAVTINGKANALAFLKKYGARPYYEEAPQVRSPYYEGFLAFQRFCLLWSRQFLTTFNLTFMPELFPGGLVQFPAHGLQCYIDEVEHTCSFETGFTTQVNLSAPAAMVTDGGPIDATKTWVHQGMIRAFLFSDLAGDPGTINNSQAQQAQAQNASFVKQKINGGQQS